MVNLMVTSMRARALIISWKWTELTRSENKTVQAALVRFVGC
jgi:hypothetical protein